jgi:hypothetical protein
MMTGGGAAARLPAMSQVVDSTSATGSEVTFGRAMGWLFFLSSLFWPRLGILAFWVFSDLLGRAYESAVVPVIGFFLLPWTTLTYAMMWGWSSDRVFGLEWVVVAIALVLDVATYAGWGRLRR